MKLYGNKRMPGGGPRRVMPFGAMPFGAMMAANSWGNSTNRGSKWGSESGSDGFFGRSGPFGGGGSFDEKGRRRRRIFGPGELRLALLMFIGEQPRHGYELIKAIGEMTGGTYEPSPGAVYPTLQMLADEGAIKPAKPEQGDEAKKAFEITETGRQELAERGDEIAKLTAKLTAMSGRAEQNRAPKLFRAMGNLASVLKNKYRNGGFDAKDIEEIVDIIDDAAKRIERL